jgi:hypothetical protein
MVLCYDFLKIENKNYQVISRNEISGMRENNTYFTNEIGFKK